MSKGKPSLSEKVVYYESIKIPLPMKKIYFRLGYKEGKTVIDREEQSRIDRIIDEAVVVIELKGASLRLPFMQIDATTIQCGDAVSFTSKGLAQLLAGSQEVVFMAATAGEKIISIIQEKSKGDEVTEAVIFDAVASEMVDAVFDWIMEFMNRQIRREGKQLLSRRFSAGYGDFSLANQKKMYDALGLKRLNITLSDTYILAPEKSVTAITGIVPVVSQQ